MRLESRFFPFDGRAVGLSNVPRTGRRVSPFNFRSLRRVGFHRSRRPIGRHRIGRIYRCDDGYEAREYELALGLLSDKRRAIDRGLRAADRA